MKEMQVTKFDRDGAKIPLSLSIVELNVILRGLSKLTVEEAGEFTFNLKAYAEKNLLEQQAKFEAEQVQPELAPTEEAA